MPVVILTGYHITKPHRLEHDHKIHSAVNTCSSTTAEAWQVLCDQLLLSVAFVAAFQPNLLFSISLVSNIFRGCGVAIPFTSVQIRGTLKDGSQFFNRQVFFHIVVIRLTKTLIKIRTEFSRKVPRNLPRNAPCLFSFGVRNICQHVYATHPVTCGLTLQAGDL